MCVHVCSIFSPFSGVAFPRMGAALSLFFAPKLFVCLCRIDFLSSFSFPFFFSVLIGTAVHGGVGEGAVSLPKG